MHLENGTIANYIAYYLQLRLSEDIKGLLSKISAPSGGKISATTFGYHPIRYREYYWCAKQILRLISRKLTNCTARCYERRYCYKNILSVRLSVRKS